MQSRVVRLDQHAHLTRARYRDGDTPTPIEPGQAYEYTIDLWSTANLFKEGHCIRLDVISSCFPHWDRTPNTGAPFDHETELRPAPDHVAGPGAPVAHHAAHHSALTAPPDAHRAR